MNQNQSGKATPLEAPILQILKQWLRLFQVMRERLGGSWPVWWGTAHQTKKKGSTVHHTKTQGKEKRERQSVLVGPGRSGGECPTRRKRKGVRFPTQRRKAKRSQTQRQRETHLFKTSRVTSPQKDKAGFVVWNVTSLGLQKCRPSFRPVAYHMPAGQHLVQRWKWQGQHLRRAAYQWSRANTTEASRLRGFDAQ